MSLGERKRKILKAVIDEYIENAEPVGSKSVAAHSGLDISSATVRNEMADLESLGYLEQPHVSAGRIPSQAGYRLYVNELMNRHRLSVREMEAINASLRMKMQELDDLIRSASRMVSQLTNYTTYAVMASGDVLSVRKIDLVLVDARCVIVIVITSSSLVRNTYVKGQDELCENDVALLSRMLNEKLAGICEDDLSIRLAKEITQRAGKLAALIPPIIAFIAEVLGDSGQRHVYLDGASRILSHPEYHDAGKAQRLLEYIGDNGVASKSRDASGAIHINIGAENGAEQLSDASVVYGTYGVGEHMKGVLGVVGPVRMDYAKVAANLNYFITGLNKLL
ncbi:MAG: heat-inducible transcriptional repressor HrcA, partial [Oscillospiraceae bacterium]